MLKLQNWLDQKSIENLNITMKLTTDNPEWKKADELYKFFDDLKFKISGLEGLKHNTQSFLTDELMKTIRQSRKLKRMPRIVTSHYQSLLPNEGFDFNKLNQLSY